MSTLVEYLEKYTSRLMPLDPQVVGDRDWALVELRNELNTVKRLHIEADMRADILDKEIASYKDIIESKDERLHTQHNKITELENIIEIDNDNFLAIEQQMQDMEVIIENLEDQCAP